MSHVADGILHAYLDGALDALSDAGELPDRATSADIVSHLSSCADCRARLEAERRIREEAGIVLSNAAPPELAAPPLSGIAAAPHRRRGPWLPLSWAATVLLAVGAGWWGSELWRAESLSTAAVEQERPSVQAQSSDVPASDLPQSDVPASTIESAEGRTAVTDAPVHGDRERPTATRSAAEAAPAAPAAVEATASEPLRTEPRVVAAPAVRQPIGAAVGNSDRALGDRDRALGDRDRALGDRSPAAAGSLAAESARSEVARLSQDALPPAAAAVRSLQSGILPQSMTLVEPQTMDAAALKQTPPGFTALAAFDSIAKDEEAGRSRFEAASPSDLRRINGQLFLVADASEPLIEVADAAGHTIVRAQQTLPSGEPIEVISMQQHATAPDLSQQGVALEALVVTGVSGRASAEADPQRRGRAAPEADPQRRARAAEPQSDGGHALPGGLAMLPGVRALADGRHEIVLRGSSGTLWVAVRADLSAEELHALVRRLRQQPPR